MAVQHGRNGLLSHLWEWLGWRSSTIAAHRVESRAARQDAEAKKRDTEERVRKALDMSEWLRVRNEQNHIAEALNAALDHPRRRLI